MPCEIQIARLIPYSTVVPDSPKEELWQVVQSGITDRKAAEEMLDILLKMHRGDGFHYRIIEVVKSETS